MVKTLRWGAAAAALGLLTGAFAQDKRPDGGTSGTRERHWEARRGWPEGAEGDRNRGDNGPHSEWTDRHRHYNPEEFLKIMKAELEKIPTLNRPMDRLMEIQAERYALQNQRRTVAIEPGERSAVVQKFHGLLRHDLELTEESRKIMKQIAADMGTIQKELDGRRNDIQKDLDAENSKPENAATSSALAQNLRRSQRSLEFLDRKLKDLESRPERMDVLSRMLRGIPLDDPPPPPDPAGAEVPKEQRIDDLQQRRRHLERQLRQTQDEIEQLQNGGKKEKEQALPR